MNAARRVAVVTGAAGGLGRATVSALTNTEVTVVPVDITGDCARFDISTAAGNQQMIDHAIAQFGQLDILVLNAGVQFMAPLSDFPEEQWDRLLDIMAKGPFLAMKAAWPWLIKQPNSRIIVTASGVSYLGAPFKVAYVAAKHAVLGVVRAAALEAAGTSLTVNAVAPGWMDTGLVRGQIADHMRLRGLSESAVLADMLRDQPGGRFVDPAQVAAMITFLASAESSGINGACIAVDLAATAG
jgi:3-hydroxybutyrate dehydrogenase